MISGQAYRYRIEDVMPGVTWHSWAPVVPDGWTVWTCVRGTHRYHRTQRAANRCAGIIEPRIESVQIVGGDLMLDERLLGRADG